MPDASASSRKGAAEGRRGDLPLFEVEGGFRVGHEIEEPSRMLLPSIGDRTAQAPRAAGGSPHLGTDDFGDRLGFGEPETPVAEGAPAELARPGLPRPGPERRAQGQLRAPGVRRRPGSRRSIRP